MLEQIAEMKTREQTSTIIIAHDNRFFSDPVIERLGEENQLDVIYCEDAWRFLEIIHGKTSIGEPKIDIMIVDGRMKNNGAFTDEQTGNDFYTGTALYNYVRGFYRKDIPFVIFSTDPEERQYLAQINDQNLKVLVADQSLPDKIMNIIRSV